MVIIDNNGRAMVEVTQEEMQGLILSRADYDGAIIEETNEFKKFILGEVILVCNVPKGGAH